MYRGSTLVQRAVDVLSSHVGTLRLGIGDISRDDWPPVMLIRDQMPHLGPIGGIQAGMSAMQTEWLVVLAVDLPFMTSEALRQLIDAAQPGDIAVAAVDESGQLHPLCALYHQSIRESIDTAIGERRFGLKGLLSSLKNVRYVTLPSATLRNVNRPEDLL